MINELSTIKLKSQKNINRFSDKNDLNSTNCKNYFFKVNINKRKINIAMRTQHNIVCDAFYCDAFEGIKQTQNERLLNVIIQN